jgi:type II secretion system protein N
VNARLEQMLELWRRFEPSPRAKRILAWVGYPLFGVVVAVITLALSVPQDRVKDRLETALSADPSAAEPLGLGMDVTIGELSVSLLSGFGFNAENVVLRTRPLNVQEKPARFIVDDVHLRMGLFGLMTNHPSYRFKGHALEGTVSGHVDNSVELTHASLELEKVSLASLPGVPLPVSGVIGGKLDVDVPKNLLANSNGTIELELDSASIGDGKAKLTVPNDPFLSAGVTVPKVRLGKLSGTIVIDKGRARFENVRSHSADADATLEGYVELRDPFPASQVHAYLKFRAAEALTKKEPTIDLLVNALAGTARRSDGYLGVQITGPVSALFYLPNREPPFGVTSRNEPAPVATTTPPPAPTPLPPSPAPSSAPPTPAPTLAPAIQGPPPGNEPAPVPATPVQGPPPGPPPSGASAGAPSPSGTPAAGAPSPSGAAAAGAGAVPSGPPPSGAPATPPGTPPPPPSQGEHEGGPRPGSREPVGEHRGNAEPEPQ